MSVQMKNIEYNAAVRAALNANNGQRPNGVDKASWAESRKPLQSIPAMCPGDNGFSAILNRITNGQGQLCARYCSVCGAQARRDDWCGANLMRTYVKREYEKLAAFVLHPANPFHSNLEPGASATMVKQKGG